MSRVDAQTTDGKEAELGGNKPEAFVAGAHYRSCTCACAALTRTSAHQMPSHSIGCLRVRPLHVHHCVLVRVCGRTQSLSPGRARTEAPVAVHVMLWSVWQRLPHSPAALQSWQQWLLRLPLCLCTCFSVDGICVRYAACAACLYLVAVACGAMAMRRHRFHQEWQNRCPELCNGIRECVFQPSQRAHQDAASKAGGQ